jgi:hypothetical protein
VHLDRHHWGFIMKRNSGIIAILTVFLAAFGISNLQKNNPSRAVSETTNKPNARAKPNASNTPTLSPATFGIGPLMGLLTTLFPSITDFATSWLQPSVQAFK